MKLIGLAVGMVLALAGAACSGDDSSPAVTTNTPTQAVTTAATSAGTPERPHTFVVRQNGAEVGRVDRTEPGQNRQVEMTLAAGTYEFMCALPGHADRGQKGTLTVR
ncbi:MAG: hypothetical protein HYX51_08795 [Chloroflexi bacterium]|nr:hypothetical protein [Chloroflexota bacterium]